MRQVYADRKSCQNKEGGGFHLLYFFTISFKVWSLYCSNEDFLLISRFNMSRLCVYSVSFKAPDWRPWIWGNQLSWVCWYICFIIARDDGQSNIYLICYEFWIRCVCTAYNNIIGNERKVLLVTSGSLTVMLVIISATFTVNGSYLFVRYFMFLFRWITDFSLILYLYFPYDTSFLLEQ